MNRRLTRIAERQSILSKRVATLKREAEALVKKAQTPTISFNIPELTQIQRAIDTMQRQYADVARILVSVQGQQNDLAKAIASQKGLTIEKALAAIGWTSINADLRDVKNYLSLLLKKIERIR
jgi:hypothetical protein